MEAAVIYAYANPRFGWVISNDPAAQYEIGMLRFATVQEAVDQISQWTSRYAMDVKGER